MSLDFQTSNWNLLLTSQDYRPCAVKPKMELVLGMRMESLICY